MTTDLPYMPAVGNVAAILQKIRGAGTPPKFTAEFVKSTLGFAASQDRSFPRILKQLQFINADGTPLPRYNEFKAASSGGRAMADGLREGWAPIFLADQVAHSRSTGESTDIFKTVTGQGDAVAKKMAATFRRLLLTPIGRQLRPIRISRTSQPRTPSSLTRWWSARIGQRLLLRQR